MCGYLSLEISPDGRWGTRGEVRERGHKTGVGRIRGMGRKEFLEKVLEKKKREELIHEFFLTLLPVSLEG